MEKLQSASNRLINALPTSVIIQFNLNKSTYKADNLLYQLRLLYRFQVSLVLQFFFINLTRFMAHKNLKY